jgi:hypothetical protein
MTNNFAEITTLISCSHAVMQFLNAVFFAYLPIHYFLTFSYDLQIRYIF